MVTTQKWYLTFTTPTSLFFVHCAVNYKMPASQIYLFCCLCVCSVQFIVIILYIQKKAWLCLSKKIILLKMTKLTERNKCYHNIKTNTVVKWSNVTSKSKVKQSLCSPGQTLRVPGVWGSQISRQSTHEVGKVVSPAHRPPLLPPSPQKIFLVLTISVRGWVDPRGHSATGRIMSMKISNDIIVNRPHDLPTCSLNKLRYRVPPL